MSDKVRCQECECCDVAQVWGVCVDCILPPEYRDCEWNGCPDRLKDEPAEVAA